MVDRGLVYVVKVVKEINKLGKSGCKENRELNIKTIGLMFS